MFNDELFLIFILHQTTTIDDNKSKRKSCFLSLFYIKPQQYKPFTTKNHGCFLSLFYIKPQRIERTYTLDKGCFLSLFYIKPQHLIGNNWLDIVVSYLYSTSNHNLQTLSATSAGVVSYLYSTSNHNKLFQIKCVKTVVSYLYSTSNHNCFLEEILFL